MKLKLKMILLDKAPYDERAAAERELDMILDKIDHINATNDPDLHDEYNFRLNAARIRVTRAYRVISELEKCKEKR